MYMKALLHSLTFLVIAMTSFAADQSQPTKKTRITFGGGCFWCIEAVFQRINGVVSVSSGYAGGAVENPTYKQVCAGDTGHAEVVQIEFDPARIPLGKLLELFWAAHDPTTLNRQGADRGTQYRSVIFYENEEQKLAAEKSKSDAQKDFTNPIVTEIAPLKVYYKAEEYHQNYYNLNASKNGYCAMVITPKLQKLLQKGLIEQTPTK